MTESRADSDRPVVEMRDITISFPGVKALQNVSFRLFPGEVHALMGENGAGKSTLIKALTGVYSIDSGTISVKGTDVLFSGPAQAQQAGIATVYQEVNLVTNLTVAENIMLGPGTAPAGLDRLAADAQARRHRAATGLNLDIDPRIAAQRPFDRRPAIGRHRPGDRRQCRGAGAGRTDVVAGRQGSRRTDGGDPAGPRQGRRGAVRLALPGSDLPDLRSHHRAAQRRTGRRVPGRANCPGCNWSPR